jgi:competence ComEA-like helix-hairpin-helix protein
MVRKININTASATELKQHPYISWNIANAIVAYRQQHGLYHSTQQLEQITIVDPGLLVKLLPYLSVQ